MDLTENTLLNHSIKNSKPLAETIKYVFGTSNQTPFKI